MSVGPVTSRYATALFELAREQGAIPEVQGDVERLAREVAGPAAALFDARVPAAEKRRRIDALAADVHPLVANLLRLVFERRRLEVLRELGAAFRRLALADRGAVEGVAESARPLSSGDLAELAVSVGSRLAKQVILENRVAPDLIAGVRVFVDNKLIDQSALGRLDLLRRRMLAAPVGSGAAKA